MLTRGAALAALLVVAGCGGSGGRTEADRCLRGLEGASIVRTIGDQRFVRFADGSSVGIVLTRSRDEAARLAPAAGGPGDPYAYEAVGRAILAWRGAHGEQHLHAVERCFA